MAGPLHHEQLYRGPGVLATLSSLGITICGVGAVGSNLADNLVRQGAGKLRVIDHDRVESRNISTQIYDEADVGVWKVESLRNHLFRACGTEIEIIRKELTAENARSLLKNSELVIDAFDNNQSRQVVQDCVRNLSAPCLHVGLHQNYCEVIWDEQYRVPPDSAIDGVCDYPLARNLVVFAVAIASEVIMHWITDDTRRSLTGTLNDFAVRSIEMV
jgi:molybdopterin/thiamine biosynthesis adenylyltransferase